MSNCCTPNTSPNTKPAKSRACPSDGEEYHSVPFATVLHHLKHPWVNTPKEQLFYFCDNPECDVVYFGQNDDIIKKDRIRSLIGAKDQSSDAMICYCFDIKRSEAISNPDARSFVKEQTKQGSCSCKTFNPSGKCCLKGFPKL